MNILFSLRLIVWVFIAAAAPANAWCASFDEDFAVVFIDAKTEAKFGAIPLDRGTLADGINAIANAGAKAIVVKFFLDQPKDEQTDLRLARALSRVPTVLQARLADREDSPNPLDARFSISGQFDVAATGARGWIPLPLFAKQAADVGFVDFNSALVPMVEQYQSHIVKSLILCAMEMAAGRKAVLSAERQIQIGSHVIRVDGRNLASAISINPQSIRSVSFMSALDGSAMAEMKNKVVILAYDGPHIDTLTVGTESIGTHRYFVSILKSIYDAK